MRNGVRAAACALSIVVFGSGLEAQDFGSYREFQLGSDVAAVSTATGLALSEVKVVHQRPAVIQELAWRPRYGVRRPAAAQTEAAEQIVFGFYNDQLFRLTVNYDRERTQGLTDADMIDAISAIYGPQVTPTVLGKRQPPSAYEEEPGTPVARWGDAEHSLMLYRPRSYTTSFRLVMTAEPLATLARTAAARAVVLDAREAPQREAARERQQADDRRAAEEKARSTNRAAFRP